MLFNSLDFMIFFPAAVLGYYILPRKIRYIWLLVCSYYFYMSWNPLYALLILTSTILTYLGSRIIGSRKMTSLSVRGKKCVLALVILANLGILIYFKYSNFFLSLLEYLSRKFYIVLSIPKVDVLLPVGISFYTFQALSYSIDVYRGEILPEKNLLKYALFVSFFPQLVAGPVERSKNLLTQIQTIPDRKADPEKIFHGLLYMLWGLFLKMVIAGRIEILVNTVFDSYYRMGGVELIAGAIGFALQIYCDFASYSTIAMGTAEVLGFTLMENFDAPYLSGSIKEFWRRWHISLSSWFRDYLYIPLGGSRCSKARYYRNLLVTFLVSGLWHGAGLHYVVWGGIHGLYQIVGDLIAPLKNRVLIRFHVRTQCFSYRFGQIFTTFLLTDFAWIFFRSPNLDAALGYIRNIVQNFDPWVLFNGRLYKLGIDRFDMNVLLVSIALLVSSDILKYFRKISIVDFLLKQNVLFQYLCIAGMLLAIFIYGAYGPAFDAQAFLYFQF
ncbi:MAG: MBOAT family protein [Blautia sp.]|nr:MBOAT family protein [Blautia sp.]